jgi:hypothetical protein
VAHPALIAAEDIEVLHGNHTGVMLRDVYGYRAGWGQVSPQQRDDVVRLMAGAPVGGSAPSS